MACPTANGRDGMDTMTQRLRIYAGVYYALAETLTEPPLWMASAGREWPLFGAVIRAARETDSEAARQAVEALSAIPREGLTARRQRYRRIFEGAGRPGLWLYESAHVDGRVFGPTALAVERVYRAAGLQPEGAERPDHASVELAFLGWLMEQGAENGALAGAWQGLASRFIEVHAGRWLPQVGRALADSGDLVYAPIGRLLADWLTEALRPPRPRRRKHASLPAVSPAENCTLCGFCVQVCPTQALRIRETDRETGLVLNPEACIACGKCERICQFNALRMALPQTVPAGPVALRTSPRGRCPHCGAPTVSAAELDAIAARLGHRPAWLDYCLDCRPLWMGV